MHVTLVDQRNYHCFQPLLYQVATAAFSPADIVAPLRRLARAGNVDVLLGTMSGVDVARRLVPLQDGGCLTFDQLVLATAPLYSFFSHPNWAEWGQAPEVAARRARHPCGVAQGVRLGAPGDDEAKS